MKKIQLLSLLIIIGCSTRAPKPTTSEVPQIESVGFMEAVPNKQLILIDHKYFQELYDPDMRFSAYVVYQMTAERLKIKVAKRRDRFKADPFLVEKKIPHVKPGEYLNSGYDKGHLAPSADFQFSQEANDLTFLMSNMAPQTDNLNQDAWRRLEDKVRKWACGEGKVTVITGPIFTEKMATLKSGLVIPPSFFKIVIDETAPRKIISFVYHQTDKGDVMSKRERTLAEIRKMLGNEMGSKIVAMTGKFNRLPASEAKWKEADCGK